LQIGRAGIRKDSWNHWQDEKLTEIIRDYEQRGEKQSAAFSAAAFAIGKSESACRGRWFYSLRKPTAPTTKQGEEKPPARDIVSMPSEDYDFRFERSDGKWKLYIEVQNTPQNQEKIQNLIAMFHQI